MPHTSANLEGSTKKQGNDNVLAGDDIESIGPALISPGGAFPLQGVTLPEPIRIILFIVLLVMPDRCGGWQRVDNRVDCSGDRHR
jgi:hypothetical protein